MSPAGIHFFQLTQFATLKGGIPFNFDSLFWNNLLEYFFTLFSQT
ncbi:hypothetical protein BTHERMOSOX_767 [Bathymodiolus thermophilus thioautotrophic gill symbiont]|nr:hypothetical protein BTHERMOSOX_767 [Bathymodiolus thermophilus thioautotrophic gill symbiont]